MTELQDNTRRDSVVEMSEREAEVQVLVPEVVRTSKGDPKARAAYRADMQHKRSVLLLLMIVPVLLIIVAWHLFDTNSKLGDSSERSASDYVNITPTQP